VLWLRPADAKFDGAWETVKESACIADVRTAEDEPMDDKEAKSNPGEQKQRAMSTPVIPDIAGSDSKPALNSCPSHQRPGRTDPYFHRPTNSSD
jgi:hypothetical protein